MTDSPLAEVVRSRRINEILEAIRQAVREHHPIVIKPKDIDLIRRSFVKGLALGERRLHEFARLVIRHFEGNAKETINLIVWGRCPTDLHEDTVENTVDFTDRWDELHMEADSTLAGIYAPHCPSCGAKCTVAASFARHIPKNPKEILFVQTRIKNPSNLCYKIADMVFDIDYMFQRDKIYNEFSQVVTDIYGLKVIVPTNEGIRKVAEFVRLIPGTSIVSEKDYTGPRKKRSGFEALKTVVRRDRQLFEIQMQSEAMYLTEQNSRSASHKTYREIQMAQRKKLGQEYISLYRALSQLFTNPEENFCSIEYIEIGPSSKGMDDEF